MTREPSSSELEQLMSEHLPIYALAIVSLLALPAPARPDPAAGPPPRDPRSALTLRLSPWDGLTLRRLDGAPVTLGAYGAGHEAIFAGSPGALESMRSYRTLKLAGTATRVGGLAAMATMISLTLAGKLSFGGTDSLPLLLPSVALELTSRLLSGAADARLSDAVDRYNAELFPPPAATLDPRGEGLAPPAGEVERRRLLLSLSLRF